MPCWGDWGAGDDVDWASVPLHTIDALPEAYRGATCYVVVRSTRWRRGSFCKSRAMDGDGGAVTSTKCPGLHPIVHGKVDGAPVRAQRDRYRRRHFSRACSSGFLQFLLRTHCCVLGLGTPSLPWPGAGAGARRIPGSGLMRLPALRLGDGSWVELRRGDRGERPSHRGFNEPHITHNLAAPLRPRRRPSRASTSPGHWALALVSGPQAP